MHWIVLLIAAAGFAGAIFSPTQGLIVVGLIIGFVSLFVGFAMLISARVAERSRPDSVLLTDADVNALRKSVRDARAARERSADTARDSADAQR